MEPAAELSHLSKADGSATFLHKGFTVIAAVNGPIEVQRRDENPFEAVVDVIVRPASGVGGTAERHLESILQLAIRQLIPVKNFPRTLVQITLQVTEEPRNLYSNTKSVQANTNLPLLPALFHAAILALLAGAVPLKCIATATTVAFLETGSQRLVVEPTVDEATSARSLHVLGFTAKRDLLLAECEGSFSSEEWSQALSAAEKTCCIDQDTQEDVSMTEDEKSTKSNILSFIRSTMRLQAEKDHNGR